MKSTMKMRIPVAFGVLAALASLDALGDDWPMWRHDPGRTAATSVSVPEKMFFFMRKDVDLYFTFQGESAYFQVLLG